MTFAFILLGIGAGVVAYIRPQYGLMLIAATVPLYTIRGTIAGIPTTALEVIILGVTLTILARTLPHVRRTGITRHRTLFYAAATFLYISTLALLAAPDLTTAAGIWKAYCVEPVLVALSCAVTLTSQRSWMRLWLVLVSVGTLIACIALIQYTTHAGIPAPWNTIDDLRATALYGYPNAIGLFLAPIVAWSIATLTQRQSPYIRFVLITCTIVCIGGIYASQSDGAWASIAAVIIALAIYYKRWALLGLVGMFGASSIILIDRVRDILLFQDTSGQVRLALWEGTLRLIQSHPLFGAGLANFPAAYDQYRNDAHVELLQYAHNLWLDFWTQFGILGAVWLLITIGVLMRAILLSRTANTPALIAVWTSIIIYGLVDVPYFKNDLSVVFWMIIAYTSFNTQQSQKNHKATS